MAIRTRAAGNVLVTGALAGIFGGTMFVMTEMAISVAAGIQALEPLRVIGSLVLGSQALSPAFPLISAALVGLALHFLLSASYGAAFTGILSAVTGMEAPSSMFLVMGIAYSMVLWTVNFLMISPALLPQAFVDSLFWLEFSFAHALYGLGLGAYLAMTSAQTEARVGR